MLRLLGIILLWRRFAVVVNQPGPRPDIVPVLPLGLKPTEQGPNGDPPHCQDQSFECRNVPRTGQGDRRQKPDPTQEVAPAGTLLSQGLAVHIDHPDMPGFHGQGLTFGAKPGEVNSKNQKDKGL